MTSEINTQRQNFIGLQDKYYFNYGGQGILPQSALNKIIDTYKFIDKIGAFGIKINSWIQENINKTKIAIASEVGAKPKTIVLTENVTSSCNIALWGIEWQEGDEILLTDAEHPGVIASIKEIARRFGVKMAVCPIIQTLNNGNPVEIIKNHLTAKTRLLVISHVLWNTGQVLPLKEIVQVCHNYPHQNKPIQVLVDGAQSAGGIPLNLIESEVDYYGCTGHKWLCGASGVGFLYIREDLLTSLRPTFIGWRGLDFTNSDLTFIDDGSRFEVATSAYPLYTGLQEAIAIHQSWGTIEERYDRIKKLSAYLWSKLQQIEGIECLKKDTPPESGLVSFYPKPGQDPQKIVKMLEEKGFFLRTLANPYCIRACVHYLTLESEIDELIAQL
ncbi:aminotransferase class V-fold PLP-dependent enzyme [Cyanobacterium sp. Dongsha4]|uniref:aminotransferase class V-fold PLP-dependent enzyme n=1 Tax=Cyanobacterium sp. DS4 TaxID=2878255 RepID=UPI002E7FF686|nr:aminotransferase class V-fold PLP-dependent enzyme [Cyanobacterium sp. Dongsha4]WVL01561.1 aminotransferase class V-fold PLP-dependent enzyme [Cyanobacterium sp. Dongsha4]